MADINFIYTYLVFLLFVVIIITAGATSFIPEDKKNELENILDTLPSERPESWWYDIPIIGPVYGFLLGVYQGLIVFWALITLSSTIRWLTLLIFTPFGVTMFYIIITRILRGSGG